jgi:hypothetical protein
MRFPEVLPGCLVPKACLVVALALLAVPGSSVAETPLVLASPSPPTASAAGGAAPERCPPAETTVTKLKSDSPDAIAAWIAKRLDTESGQDRQDLPGDDSRCECVINLAVALAPADPAHAGDIQQAFAKRFPDCGLAVTYGLEESLATAPISGPAPKLVDTGPTVPGINGSGGSGGGCGRKCAAVEPGKGDAASRTGL